MTYQYTAIVLNPKTRDICELWIDWTPDGYRDLNLYLSVPGGFGKFGRAYISLRETRDVNHSDYVRSHSPGGLDYNRQGEGWGFVLYTSLALMAYSTKYRGASFEGIFSVTDSRTQDASNLWARLVDKGIADLYEIDEGGEAEEECEDEITHDTQTVDVDEDFLARHYNGQDGEVQRVTVSYRSCETGEPPMTEVWTYDGTKAVEQGILLHIADGPLSERISEEMLDNFPDLDALLNVRAPKDDRARDWFVSLLVSRGATMAQIGEWAAINDLRSVQLPLNLSSTLGMPVDLRPQADEDDDDASDDSQQAFAFNGAEVRPHVTPARRRAIEAAWQAAYGDLEDMP